MTIERLVVLDSSFDGGMGHHRLLNQNLTTLAADRGWDQVLLCGSDFSDRDGFPETVDVRPLVGHGIYHRYGRHGVDRVLGFNRRALDGLRELPSELFDAGTALYVHTTSEVEVLALSVWLEELATRGVRSVLGMMFPPHNQPLDEGEAPTMATLAAAVYRRALERLVANPLVTIAAYGPGLTATFERFIGAPVWCLPSPILPLDPSGPAHETPAERLIPDGSILLYAGDGRNDKGLHLIAAVARHLLSQHVDHPIAVQVSGTYAEQHLVALNELEELARSTSLILVHGRLDPAEYRQIWQNLDLICCFYNAREYRYKTSGMGWEAMEYGVPAVLAPDLWHAQELAHYGHPFVEAASYWPDDLAHAVRQAVDTLALMKTQAAQSQQGFLASNNVESLLAPLLDESGAAPAAAAAATPIPLYDSYVPAFVGSGF